MSKIQKDKSVRPKAPSVSTRPDSIVTLKARGSTVERDNKRRKTSHPWLDIEAHVTPGEDKDEDEAWEIGMQ